MAQERETTVRHLRGPVTSRRLPTRAQLRVWRDYIETSEQIRSRLGSRMQNDSNLSLTDYQVLLELNEAGGQRLRSSELAAKVGWERSRLSHHLGRMEGRGLIRREACADDSRGSFVVLSDEGRAAFRRGSILHLKAVQALFFEALSEEQLGGVAAATAALRAHLNRETVARTEGSQE